jgi:hypothetical protein
VHPQVGKRVLQEGAWGINGKTEGLLEGAGKIDRQDQGRAEAVLEAHPAAGEPDREEGIIKPNEGVLLSISSRFQPNTPMQILNQLIICLPYSHSSFAR